MFIVRVIAIILASLFIASAGVAGHIPLDISSLKRGVVSIENNIIKSNYLSLGRQAGTGFVVDRARGLLLTNNHVTPRNAVQEITVIFFNGKEAKAKIIYNDPMQDFAFLKVATDDIPEDVIQLELSANDPAIGQEVFIIGNNERRGFSVQDGRISKIYGSRGGLYGQDFTVSLNARGGSSGSPVLNNDKQVAGIIFGGGETYSLGCPVQYLRDALQVIQQDKIPQRKDMGAVLSYTPLDQYIKYASFSQEVASNYIKKYPDSDNQVIYIAMVHEDSPAYGILEPGDIIWSIDGNEVGPSIYKVQKMMNEAKNDAVKLGIYRHGKSVVVDIKVYDLHKTAVKKMLLLCNATFYEVDNVMRSMSGAPLGSLFVSAPYGSCLTGSVSWSEFAGFGVINLVNVTRVDNIEVKNLDDLVKIVPHLVKKEKFSIRYRNFGIDQGFADMPFGSRSLQEGFVDYYAYDSDPVLLTYDERRLEWIAQKIELSDK